MHDMQHPHEHGHTHDHEHSHTHPHEHGGFASPEQAMALMKYMLDHNQHHAEELHEVCHKLEDMGKAEAAEKLGRALNSYYEGNAFLAEALKALEAE